jgi:polysaccharide pyruvyl transferase WcaK-like protein
MTIRIWHIASHTTNIGDGALISGIHSTLREDWPRPIEFINDNLMEYADFWGSNEFNRELVKRINEESDMLLIGGGGMLDGARVHRYTGMAFNLPYQLWQEIKVPVVFYALGFNLFRSQHYWHKNSLKQTVAYILSNHRMLLSFRNDGSLYRARQSLNVKWQHAYDIPDPGLYVPLEDTNHPVLLKNKMNILLQLAGDNPYFRFNYPLWRFVPHVGKRVLEQRVRQYFDRIGKTIEALLKNYDVNFILCPHLVRDFGIMSDFISCLSPSVSRFHFNASGVLRGTSQASVFFDLYRKSDLIIGMRGHSMICGVGVGTPVVAISTHDKVDGFMHSVALDDRLVQLSARDMSSKLLDIVSHVINNREQEKKRLSKIKKKCREVTRMFHMKMFGLIRQ